MLKIDGAKYDLLQDKYTAWVQVRFRVMPGMRVYGVCKFLLLQTEPHFDLYVTPINIDPENPVMPIGYPSVYPVYLAKQQGLMDGHRTAGEDAERMVADLPAMAIGTVDHVAAPALAHAGHVGQIVDHPRGHQQPARRNHAAIVQRHREAIAVAGG